MEIYTSSNRSISLQDGNLLDYLFRWYVLLCLYTPFLYGLTASTLVSVVDDAFFIGLLILSILPLASSKKNVSLVVFVLPLYLGFSCIVSVASGNDFSILLLSLKNNKNIFLFIILLCLVENHSNFVRNQIKFILFASVPIVIFQFFTVDEHDDITGLFGPKSTSLYSMLACVFISIEILERKKSKSGYFGAYLLLFIPVFLNETKVTFVIFPAMLVFFFLLDKQLSIKSLLIIVFSCFSVLLLLNIVYYDLYGYKFTEIFTYDYMILYFFEYTELHEDIPRLYRLFFAYEYIFNGSVFEYLFGNGIGSVYVGDGGNRLGSVSKELEFTNFNSGSRIQIFQMLIDYGVFGTALFIFIFLMWLVKFSFLKIKNRDALYAIGLLFIMIACLIYQNMLFTKQLSFLFYYYVYQLLIRKVSVR